MGGGAWQAAVHGSRRVNTTEGPHFHFSLSCIGEGNGNPLQCSCLENPRDRGAWWAAVYGVAQSRTRLKRLSSSSSSIVNYINAHAKYRQLCLCVWVGVFSTHICSFEPLNLKFLKKERLGSLYSLKLLATQNVRCMLVCIKQIHHSLKQNQLENKRKTLKKKWNKIE